jgi:tRNA threonylcarbamoyladenosine biosynthesis protein TsaE
MKTDSYSERMAQLTEAGVRVDSPEAMISLGRDVAAGLHAGSVLALQGGLGAGKTHFTKGIAQGLFDDLADGLGGSPEVTSPTFTLVHEYQGGRLPLYHFDFYRMGSEEEVLRIGWDEYLDEDGVVVVEWPDKFPNLIPAQVTWLSFEHDDGARIVKLLHS